MNNKMIYISVSDAPRHGSNAGSLLLYHSAEGLFVKPAGKGPEGYRRVLFLNELFFRGKAN